MSHPTIAEPVSRRKAARIAADTSPGAMYRLNVNHYLVRTLTEPTSRRGTYVAVEREHTGLWRCSCSAGESSFACQHKLAVMRVDEARTEALRFARGHNIPPEELAKWLLDSLAEPGIDLDWQDALSTYLNALTVPPIVVALRYWWRDYQPWALFDDADAASFIEDHPVEVRWGDRPGDWRPATQPLSMIRDYIADHNLSVGPIIIEPRSRRTGGWEGQFRLHLVNTANSWQYPA